MKFLAYPALIISLASIAFACEDEEPATEVISEATVVLRDYDSGDPDIPVRGKAVFTQDTKGVVTAIISVDQAGLGMRTLGVHIHTGGLENPGMHFNADLGTEKACNKTSLGTSWNKPYIGDVGNIVTNEQGTGSLSIQTDLWNISDPTRADNILDRTLIIHYGESFFDQECDPNHVPGHTHSNPKYVQGEIKAKE